MPENETPTPDSLPLFSTLKLRPEVEQAVVAAGYTTPTPVQAQIIPPMLEGRDVLAQSQTGTGKTAAFALPILSRIDPARAHPQTLVLAPTRELAIQVAKSFTTYGKHIPGFQVAAIYGGQDYQPQLKQLRRGVPVVVGTPGRVIDHVKRGTLDLSQIECLVLDEADEMLNMGFLEDVQFVLQQLPEARQIALFSATLPAPIRTIAEQYLPDPVKIRIQTKTMTAASIRQRAVVVAPHEKLGVLTRMLEVETTDGVIVFTKTREATLSVAEQLRGEGLAATALNGDMPQKVRERTIEQLQAGRLDILVATDVAARGLDVPRISHVFNFDLPHDSESYVHRIGRTGRAGRAGEAILFCTRGQRGKLRAIEKMTHQPIEMVDPPTATEVNAQRVARFQEQITTVTAEQDLTMFKELIEQYANESGKPLEMIAAALAHLSQQGRPFLATAIPAGKPPKRGADRHSDQFDRTAAPRRGAGKPFRSGPPPEGMSRYRIEVGRRDGVKPGNIVGAVANEGGIDNQMIGAIKIHTTHSTIELPEGMPRAVFQTLRSTWVAGKQLRLRPALASDDESASPGGKPPYRGKPGGNKAGSGSGPGKPTAGKKAKKFKGKTKARAGVAS